ncbi:MAG: UPF0149 family protein [Pseudomonadota bacterium]
MSDIFPSDGLALDFDDFANQLLAEGAEQSPSYLHGGLCGIYAGAGPVTAEDCLAAAAQALELALHGELAESCLTLADISRRAMQDEGFDFQLFLPGDELEMEQRVQALADWCRGFLAAYALVVSEERAGLGEETGEVLRDVAAIAEAGHDEDAEEEAAESDFFELTEYLRFACLNLFMNRLAELEDADAASAPQQLPS